MSESKETGIVYYGEQNCTAIKASGDKCTNKAYYYQDRLLRCGVHSKKDKRITLRENPNKERNYQEFLEIRQCMVEEKAKENREQKKKGNIILSKLRMMKEPEHFDGYLKVFPNFKHQNRKDGFGCKSLSPKDIGPIYHKQPNLPPALNLENMHQSGKVFPNEQDEKGNPTDEFYETQLKMYLDPVPHRHKEQAHSQKGNKNIPVYSVWVLPDGEELHLSYFESREIYCKIYEQLTRDNKDLLKLRKFVNNGYNLQIVGYDAYSVKETGDIVKDLEKCYKDTSKPFGHELVLYTLLCVNDSEKYPWNKYGKLDI